MKYLLLFLASLLLPNCNTFTTLDASGAEDPEACVTYCDLLLEVCISFPDPSLGANPDKQSCVEECDFKLTNDVTEATALRGNTVQCRINHIKLGISDTDPGQHCPHAYINAEARCDQ